MALAVQCAGLAESFVSTPELELPMPMDKIQSIKARAMQAALQQADGKGLTAVQIADQVKRAKPAPDRVVYIDNATRADWAEAKERLLPRFTEFKAMCEEPFGR